MSAISSSIRDIAVEIVLRDLQYLMDKYLNDARKVSAAEMILLEWSWDDGAPFSWDDGVDEIYDGTIVDWYDTVIVAMNWSELYNGVCVMDKQASSLQVSDAIYRYYCINRHSVEWIGMTSWKWLI